ncbi:MAG: hypothetical protein HY437_01900 [Candidatus Magasanikbacteria bacterium]|nr:hypothetical protein [Candidatus Magasanikbacteria bacterium]
MAERRPYQGETMDDAREFCMDRVLDALSEVEVSFGQGPGAMCRALNKAIMELERIRYMVVMAAAGAAANCGDPSCAVHGGIVQILSTAGPPERSN